MNKIFADISRDGLQATVKLSADLQDALTGARPDTYVPAPGYWGRSGWTLVTLANVQAPELKQLLNEGWRLIAPKALEKRTPRAKASVRKGSRTRAKPVR